MRNMMCFPLRVWICAVSLAGALAVLEARAADRDLLVTCTAGSSPGIHRYDGVTGQYLGVFACSGTPSVRGLAYGQDGNLYVSIGPGRHCVLRLNGQTGEILDDPWASGCGLSGPVNICFGPDGNLYVCSYLNGGVMRYDGTTGACMGDFISPGSGGLADSAGIAWGPANSVYVGTSLANRGVKRYNSTTGAYIDDFIPQSRCPAGPVVMGLGPEGYLYVGGYDSGTVRRYDATTGALIDEFVPPGTLSNPTSNATWGPDGNFYVVSSGSSRIQRYDRTTGAFMGTFASGPEMAGPWAIIFMPHPADFDADKDVDLKDLERFEACVSGPTISYQPAALPPGCTMPVDADARIAADFDKDGDVDQDDFGSFQRCFSGTGKPADPACVD